jgi:myo-inositol-1(or 4)-monophosphatase
MNLDSILKDIIQLAENVGEYQLANFRNENIIKELKSSNIDLVTEVDKKSEVIIRKKLNELFPDHGILGEEEDEQKSTSKYRWVLDPLDGTINYASGLPIFAVSIALEYDGKSILGVVHTPYIGETFWAIKGKGAYRNGIKLKVGNKTELVESVVATGFPYDRAQVGFDKNNVNYLKNIMPKVRGIRRMGAAAYDLCLVASGNLDGYWEMGLKLWDVAAASLIIEEAGGIIHHFRDDRNISITAGNPIIADKLLEEIENVDNEPIDI